MFEHLPLHLEARNKRIKEMAFFKGEVKYSKQVQIGAINCAPPFSDQREDFNTCRNGIDSLTHGEKIVPVHPLSSRGINKFHLEGDCHLESNIEAFKVYQCLSKLSRSFASYESSKPHEYNLKNIRDMKNSEATKQSMPPDTSTCVVDHNEELSKESVTDCVMKTDEKSVPISSLGQRTFQV